MTQWQAIHGTGRRGEVGADEQDRNWKVNGTQLRQDEANNKISGCQDELRKLYGRSTGSRLPRAARPRASVREPWRIEVCTVREQAEKACRAGPRVTGQGRGAGSRTRRNERCRIRGGAAVCGRVEMLREENATASVDRPVQVGTKAHMQQGGGRPGLSDRRVCTGRRMEDRGPAR